MTAAASLRDSSSALEADLGKGRVMPQRDRRLFTPPVASLPERESRGQSRPQNVMLTGMRFSTPSHSRTHNAAAILRVYPPLGCCPWLRSWPPLCGMATSGLPSMNRSGLCNPPIQGGAFLLPPRNPSRTERAFLPSGHQANLPSIYCVVTVG